MGRPGFEPGTNRLKAEYSTVELATRWDGGSKRTFPNIAPRSRKGKDVLKKSWAIF